MVHTSAVICEFNPLHRGHEMTLNRAKAETEGAVVAVMSGNLTQRSECAVFDKYKRAEAAVRSGADLVVELPFPWCSAGGEFFALGGVAVALGVGASAFVFGSESGDINSVKAASELADSSAFRKYLDSVTDMSSGAAEVYDNAMRHFGISLGPNDRLASEYMRASRRLEKNADKLKFIFVKRMEEAETYRSASDIREMLTSKDMASQALRYITDQAAIAYWPTHDDNCGICTDIWPNRLEELEYLFFRFFARRDAMQETADGGGGIIGRLFSAAHEAQTSSDFYRLAYTKKYTCSRIRRAALFALLNVSEESLRKPPLFTVLLASNKRGREHLSEIRRKAGITVLTKPSASHKLPKYALKQYELYCRADDLYSLCLRNGSSNGEFLRRIPYFDKI